MATRTEDSRTGQYFEDGLAVVKLKQSEIIPPAAYYLTWAGTAGTNDDDVVYTSPDVSEFNFHMIEATAGALDVWGSMDGVNYSPVALAGNAVNNASSTARATSISAGNMVQIWGKWKHIRVDQTGATAANGRGSHGVV